MSVAEPESKQKQHSKNRRTDMLVFETRPITCLMLLICENEDFRSKEHH